MARRTVRSTVSVSTVVIVVLIILAVCTTAVVAVLIGTGVIRLDGSKPDDGENTSLVLIDNPNKRVTANGRLIEVENLEFYLPYGFELTSEERGASHYELKNNEGQAEVVVYIEKSSLKPDKYLKEKDSYLSLTKKEYELSGTTWAEAGNASSLAYATKFGDYMYGVFCTVSLNSSKTEEAMQSISKTLYMKKLYN